MTRVNPAEQPTAPKPQQPTAPNPPRDLLRIDQGWKNAVKKVLRGRPPNAPQGTPRRGRRGG
jgi:hypothetical protein